MIRKMFFFGITILFILSPLFAFAGTGDLQVTCEPKVRIFIDGEFKGVTNEFDNGLFLEGLTQGKHMVKAVKTGYEPKFFEVTIIEYKAVEVKIQFEELQERVIQLQPEIEETVPQVGNFELRSAPLGAQVYIDGEYKGDADIRVENAKSGEHEITFRKGKLELSDKFVLHPGETLKLKAHFKKKTIINISEIEKAEAGKKGKAEGERIEKSEKKEAAAMETERVSAEATGEEQQKESMVFLKGGCFQMGDVFGEGDAIEKPVHEVCVDDFLIDKYEVAQKVYNDIMEYNPSRSKGGKLPVTQVTWRNARSFCEAIGKRLPTEAEWEFAARSLGKKEKWSGTGKENTLKEYAWYAVNSGEKFSQVGKRKPNALGIYDMSGNVWEWVSDHYGEDYYRKSPKENPTGPGYGKYRIIRGGSWKEDPYFVRTTYRFMIDPIQHKRYDIGFRCARNP